MIKTAVKEENKMSKTINKSIEIDKSKITIIAKDVNGNEVKIPLTGIQAIPEGTNVLVLRTALRMRKSDMDRIGEEYTAKIGIKCVVIDCSIAEVLSIKSE